MQKAKFKVLKKRNRKNVVPHTHNNEYPTIDEKVASIVDSKQYEDFFKTPRDVFGRTLSPAEKQYWIKKILPYQMQQLGYTGVIVRSYKDNIPVYADHLTQLLQPIYNKDNITAYANHLTQQLEPIYNKKQNTPHDSLTSQELERCRKIQKAYTGLLQLGQAKDEFKSSFPILDDWMHNHKVASKKMLAKFGNEGVKSHLLAKKQKYQEQVNANGFFVNTHTTMDKKKKHQTNILLSANNKEQDNKLIGNKRKIEDCLFDGLDNENFTKKNNTFDFLNFHDNGYENNSIGNNFIFNDNGYENNSIGKNDNLSNKSFLNLNSDKTFKDLDE